MICKTILEMALNLLRTFQDIWEKFMTEKKKVEKINTWHCSEEVQVNSVMLVNLCLGLLSQILFCLKGGWIF